MKDKPTVRVLVVDDYENWRVLLKSILEDDGHEVVTASTHSEAKEELRDSTFDVVILDMRLVDDQKYNVEGMKLLKKIKGKAPSTGAIILTGYPDPLHESRALSTYGADAYLSKVPDSIDFDIEAFSELVVTLAQQADNR